MIAYAARHGTCDRRTLRRHRGPRAARGDGPLAARPRRPLRRLRADALPGRARGDQPDAVRRGQDRRRPRADASRSCCAWTRATASPSCGTASGSQGGHARRPPLRGPDAGRCPASAPRSRCTRCRPGAATGGPGDPPMHEAGSRETAWSCRAACASSATASRTSSRRATRSRSTPTLPTTSRTPAAARRSSSR